ncbi:trypsin-like peptidase domain-containing protein [Streptomyces sp. S.PNR 29]|uniref:trypsin-like peptidase domain-containing protein n=1 Tax=Streptomyces sp. S.PNR 29 TaxID=2973805 RepID=UPI0025AF7939|nr:trypsin-like peptidase domain-containing protein [Streptomyces sp. S.PNR 29]MDN0201254.1 serine protease [Streptomyces sp. S.PNR 29]
MAARGPHPRDGAHGPQDARLDDALGGADRHAPDEALVRIHDPAGRPRGTGFVADRHGTLITSHEAVDGLPRLVLHTADGRRRVVTAAAVTPLPALDLALVHTGGLGVAPLPVTARDRIDCGTYVRIAAGCWREARILGTTTVTYTATGRLHRLDGVLELAIGTDGRDALRLGGGAAGGPVLDATTGAVLGVLGTALSSDHSEVGFAVPLLPGTEGPLGDLLAANGATVPAYGADLNLAGVRELTATSMAQDGPLDARPGLCHTAEPVERAATAREFAAFTEGPARVLGLVGAPGSGRTTELAALAARRHSAPTLWLRGADLRDDDTSVADAARRALTRAARIVAATRVPLATGLGDTSPERLARLARDTGHPLLLLLDTPEETPSALTHRLSEWAEGTAQWLRETGARLVVACRVEYWERAGAEFPAELLHEGRSADEAVPGVPPCVPLGDLTEDEARQARVRYGVPEGALPDADARHPLTLRLLSEVRAAESDPPAVARTDRHEVFSAYLDLMCLRIAQRLAAQHDLRGTAVRRLAAKVSGQVHEAARRSIGTGQGGLDRASFEEVFPWGPAPDRLGGGTGWASAVLAEGLLVPAGDGYRFAHEEIADWIQGTHLDLDEALRVLVHRCRLPQDAHPLPVPHHRIGPVVQALLLLARRYGTLRLALQLQELVHALDADPHSWWAARLVAEVLRGVPDAAPYTDVLRLLADRIVAWRSEGRPVPGEFGPALWTALSLPLEARLDLLRRLVHADGPPDEAGPRYLDAVARLLAADAVAVQPLLTRWFDDERPLPATPHATVATAAQALLHTHRRRALDELTEVLVDRAHRRAGQLLAVLAEEEPSAVCRAVGRWAHDERPARRAAAVTHGLRAAPHARTEADRALLRHAALTLLARPADSGLHGGALALLVRDPSTRARHLPQALRQFAAGDPQIPPSAIVAALTTHPTPVLDAFRARLRGPDAGEVLRTLADATTPTLARRVAALVGEAVAHTPHLAAHVAAYADRRLDRGPADRAVLRPLVTGLLDGGPEPVRTALAAVLAAPGNSASRHLRRELREHLLAQEHDPAVLDALLHAAARISGHDLRDLVHRTGLLLVRTTDGAARFDRALADLGRHVPGFALRVTGWLTDAPEEWVALVGPGTRRMIETLAGVRVPA